MDIQNCNIIHDESPRKFAMTSKSLVDFYTNHTGHIRESSNLQFAVLEISNDKISSDNLITLTFQIKSSMASVETEDDLTYIEWKSRALRTFVKVMDLMKEAGGPEKDPLESI